MDPVIVILSFGTISPEEITKYLVKTIGTRTTSQTVSIGLKTYVLQSCDLKTKYYKNTVSLLPFNGDFYDIPDEILSITEALIIFFNSENSSFLKRLPGLQKGLLSYHNIGLRIILTDKMHDNSNTGVTFSNIKNTSQYFFDIVELFPEKSNENKLQNACFNELLDILYCNMWSNVNNTKGNEGRNNLIRFSGENQLESFELLVKNIQNFRKVASTLRKEEILDKAERFAELFSELICEDES